MVTKFAALFSAFIILSLSAWPLLLTLIRTFTFVFTGIVVLRELNVSRKPVSKLSKDSPQNSVIVNVILLLLFFVAV